jgi:hypothetical protein
MNLKNIITCFLLLIIQQITFAKDSYTLTLNVVDSYTHKSISNYEVQFRNELNELLFYKEVKNDTVVTLENFTWKSCYIRIITKNDNYLTEVANDFISNKKKENMKHTIYLYPSEKYEKQILHIEDSIYGPRKADDPMDAFNEPDTSIVDAKTEVDMYKFIAENTFLPKKAMENLENGKIVIAFIVETDGTVTHFKIHKGRQQEILKAESFRVVRQMKWIAGHTKNGEKIREYFRLPFEYR